MYQHKLISSFTHVLETIKHIKPIPLKWIIVDHISSKYTVWKYSTIFILCMKINVALRMCQDFSFFSA